MIILFLCITILLSIIFFRSRKNHSYWASKGVPGPTALPFFGTFLDESLRDGKKTEKRFFKKYGSYFGTYYHETPVFNTCDQDQIRQILDDTETFQNFGIFFMHDKYVNKSLFFQNGQKWKDTRRIMSTHFTSRKLKSVFHHFEQASKNFLENIEFIRKSTSSDEIDAKEMSKHFAIDMISKYMFAVDIDSFKNRHKSEFAKQAMRMGDFNYIHIILLYFIPRSLLKPLGFNIFKTEPFDKLGDLFSQMIDKRDPKLRYDDMAEVLMNAIEKNETKMDKQEVVANSLLGFFAGTDTTSHALAKVFYFLAENPECQEKLYDELKANFSDKEITYENLMDQDSYLHAFVCECLRLGQSILGLEKLATKDVLIKKGNISIKKGTVCLSITYLNHVNPEYFPDPEKFDPNRFYDKSPSNPNIINNQTFMPFSSGPRQCLGMRFALLEIKYLLSCTLLKYNVYKSKNFKLNDYSKRRFCFNSGLKVCLRERIQP